jgi:hypothetical protein
MSRHAELSVPQMLFRFFLLAVLGGLLFGPGRAAALCADQQTGRPVSGERLELAPPAFVQNATVCRENGSTGDGTVLSGGGLVPLVLLGASFGRAGNGDLVAEQATAVPVRGCPLQRACARAPPLS